MSSGLLLHSSPFKCMENNHERYHKDILRERGGPGTKGAGGRGRGERKKEEEEEEEEKAGRRKEGRKQTSIGCLL